MHIKKFLFALLALSSVFLLSSCDKKDEQPEPVSSSVSVAEFLGRYAAGSGSFWVPLDSNNVPITSEKRDITGELLTVSKGSGDTLILSSPTLGTIKAIPKVNGQKVELTIPQQFYNGVLNPSGAPSIIVPVDAFFFIKDNDGKKFFDSNSGNGIFSITIGAMRAGNRYQVSIRRSGVS